MTSYSSFPKPRNFTFSIEFLNEDVKCWISLIVVLDVYYFNSLGSYVIVLRLFGERQFFPIVLI